MLNGHEYVACQAAKAGICFTKEGNCFTSVSDAAGLAKIADTLLEASTIGRLRQVRERWIYSAGLCFAFELEEQGRSGFPYQYSNFQLEYSHNLMFNLGSEMEQVFQTLIDRSRARSNLKTINPILGYRHRRKYHKRNGPRRVRHFLANQKVVTIRALGGGLAKSTITNSGPSTKADGDAKLIFHRYGSQYFLVAAWMPNAEHAQELLASASENQTAGGKERQEIDTLLMESVRSEDDRTETQP